MNRSDICCAPHPNARIFGGIVCHLFVDSNGAHAPRAHKNGTIEWPVAHDLGAMPSAAGWCATCPCGWSSDNWYRAKNSAMREARDHVRGESAAAGARAVS